MQDRFCILRFLALSGATLLLAMPVAAQTDAPKVELKVEAEADTNVRAEARAKVAPSRLLGEWPDPSPTVSINIEDAPLSEGLMAVSKAAGWGLALTAPPGLDDNEITLQLENRPATEVLTVLLESANLDAKLVGDLMVVTPHAGAQADDAADVRIGDLRLKVKHGPGSKHGRVHGGKKSERVNMGGDVTVGPGEVVDEAVAMGGDVTIQGKVLGDAVSMGGDVLVESGGEVMGEAVAMGGEVIVEDGATVHGDRVSLGGSLGNVVTGIIGIGSAKERTPPLLLGFLATLLRAIVLLVLALLIIAFMPGRVERISTFLSERPAPSVLGGLGLLVGFAPLVLLLAITVIGIPLIPLAALTLMAFLVVGLTTFATWLGFRIPLFEENKTPMKAMLIGLAVVTLVDFIPLVGTPVIVLVAFVSAGAVMLSRFGQPRPAGAPREPMAPLGDEPQVP